MQTTIREEQILNKTAKFPPLTKDEMFLSKVMEEGGGGGAMKATANMIVDAGTGNISFGDCTKTGTELADAIESGTIPYLVLSIYAGETLIAITVCYASSYQPIGEGYITSFMFYDQSTDSNEIILVYDDGHVAMAD